MAAGLEYAGGKTEFRGYDTLTRARPGSSRSTARAHRSTRSASGDSGIVVLDQTPFYAESGGQVGDRGVLVGGAAGTFEVDDTQKIQAEVFGHHGVLRDRRAEASATWWRRASTSRSAARTMRNHSVTHLMHEALREVLGPARAAEGLAGRRRQDALRLLARQRR